MDGHEDSPLLARVVASEGVPGGRAASGDVTGGGSASGGVTASEAATWGVTGGGAAMDSPLLARVVAELPEIFRHEILPLLVGCGGYCSVLHVMVCY
jgi:hypothetical protein